MKHFYTFFIQCAKIMSLLQYMLLMYADTLVYGELISSQ